DEAVERVSDDIEEMETVLTSMDAASILTSGGVQVVPIATEVATATVSIPTGSRVVSTASHTIPTAAPIFTTAIESTPYTRRKGNLEPLYFGAVAEEACYRLSLFNALSALEILHSNLFPPLDNPELTIQRRSHSDPTLLNNSEIAAEGPGDLPVPNLRTMKELCQPSLNGRGGPIAPIAIQATNFRLKNDMIQQVQNSCQFHGLSGDDANKHLDKFLHVNQSIKVNGVTDDALRLYDFPHSLTHHATTLFDHLPRNSINTFEQMAKMFLGKYFPPSMVTKLKNEITNFCQRPDESLFEAWERYKCSID
nr:reverse transcriptase domain-containing protein [Tanacetum cinerariifolium]